MDSKRKSTLWRHTKNTIFWIFVLALIGAFLWGIIRGSDLLLFWAERQSHSTMIALAISEHVLIWVSVVIGLSLLLRSTPKGKTVELLWLYVLIGTSVLLSGGDLKDYMFLRTGARGHRILQHTAWSAIDFRLTLVTLLIGLGALLYLFKRHYKFIYGISEIIVGVFSTLKVFERTDATSLRQMNVQYVDAIALLLFTYLTSRGFSNVVEGIDEWKARALARQIKKTSV
jgi:hypothetical protein